MENSRLTLTPSEPDDSELHDTSAQRQYFYGEETEPDASVLLHSDLLTLLPQNSHAVPIQSNAGQTVFPVSWTQQLVSWLVF